MLSIEGHPIGEGHPCFIIAEIGVNHNGDPGIAAQMVEVAAECGVDCVKFQTFHAEEFCNGPDETYEYVSQGQTVTESMLSMFQRLELKRDVFKDLFQQAHDCGLVALSTPTDRSAADLLESLGAKAFKIGSDDLVHTPFLKYVASKEKPIIISTGMAGAADIERAIKTIRQAGNDQIIVLHCVSQYPTPDDKVNLRRISDLQEAYGLPVGFSDHSWGTTAAMGAVALGACVVEKHFTLDRNMSGPDHGFSADPEELAALVKAVRHIERNLGDGGLEQQDDEVKMGALSHRSIVAARDLAPGHVLAEDDLAYRRPGTGLMPYETERIIGRRLRIAVPAGTKLALDHLEGSHG